MWELTNTLDTFTGLALTSTYRCNLCAQHQSCNLSFFFIIRTVIQSQQILLWRDDGAIQLWMGITDLFQITKKHGGARLIISQILRVPTELLTVLCQLQCLPPLQHLFLLLPLPLSFPYFSDSAHLFLKSWVLYFIPFTFLSHLPIYLISVLFIYSSTEVFNKGENALTHVGQSSLIKLVLFLFFVLLKTLTVIFLTKFNVRNKKEILKSGKILTFKTWH